MTPEHAPALTQAAGFLDFDRVAIHLGGREILSPTSFSVSQGEFVCIVGPSGCGKTTLLRAATGLHGDGLPDLPAAADFSALAASPPDKNRDTP